MSSEDASEMWYTLARFQKAKSVVITRTGLCQIILWKYIYKCQCKRTKLDLIDPFMRRTTDIILNYDLPFWT